MLGDFIDATADGCYEWRWSRFTNGYARVKLDGRTFRLQRLVWEAAHGPIPDGLWVLHRCDNRACVRLDHLFLGTHADNMADMAAKGRASRNETKVYTRGDMHPNARLTDAQIEEIRETFEAGGTSQQAIANSFGVSQALVSKIVRGLHR